MSDQNNKNSGKRFIGKIKNYSGKSGTFQKILINNVNAQNADGSVNQYWKGNLLWLDKETGKKFIVKRLSIHGVGQRDAQNNFAASIALNLEEERDVDPR